MGDLEIMISINLRTFGILTAVLTTLTQGKDGPRKIGIIGAGIGGTSAAFYLRENFGPDVDIYIFEEGQNVGGRLAVLNMADSGQAPSLYEVGGSVIHPRNRLMLDLVEKAGLKAKPTPKGFDPSEDTRFTIYGTPGAPPLFEMYFANSYLQKLELLWHYGVRSLMKMDSLVKSLLNNFSRVYDHLEFGHWTDTDEFLRTVGQHASKLVGKSLYQSLEDNGVHRSLIEELVTVAVRVNYGQMPGNVHAFVGYIALAGAEGGLWSIEGGNFVLTQELIKLSQAKLVMKRVIGVKRDDKDSSSGGGGDMNNNIASENLVLTFEDDTEMHFDMVVVATPQTADKKPLTFGKMFNQTFPGTYHQTVATLVRCKGLNPAFFSQTSQEVSSKGHSGSRNNFYVRSDSALNSISKIYPVSSKHNDLNVYKVFSQEPLSSQVLDSIFINRTKTIAVDWLAYPHYEYGNMAWTQTFKLAHNLYYTSAVEGIGSAMEMSALAAKNVANYAFNDWFEVKLRNKTSTKYEL